MKYKQKIFLILLAILFQSLLLFSRCEAEMPPTMVWTDTYDLGADDYAYSIAVDDSGCAYITGECFFNGHNNCVTIKYDANGNTIWDKIFYNNGLYDNGYGLALDKQNNFIYVNGISCSLSNEDFSVLKYKPNGDTVWQRIYEDSGDNDYARRVAVDQLGNIYAIGVYYNMLNSTTDLMLIKYKPNGDTEWVRQYDRGDNDEGAGITTDPSGNVYVTGASSNGINQDCIIIKYDINGNTLWTRIYNGGNEDIGLDLKVDNLGNVYVVGARNNVADSDWLVMKYDTNGNTIWIKTYGEINNDYASGIAIDNLGCAYVVGYCNGIFSATDDILVIKYDGNGNTVWQTVYDNGYSDCGRGIAIDNAKDVYVTGYSQTLISNDYLTIKYHQYIVQNTVTNPLVPVKKKGEVLVYTTGRNGIARPDQNERVIIRFKPISEGNVKVSIYAITGELVWQNSKEITILESENNLIEWLCDNNEGTKVASGVYLIVTDGPGIQTNNKIVVMR